MTNPLKMSPTDLGMLAEETEVSVIRSSLECRECVGVFSTELFSDPFTLDDMPFSNFC